MAIPANGLNNIRTLSGKIDEASLPYRAYMQITCLEMERVRRTKERNSAALRIQAIDTRLKEIDRTKQELLQAVSGETPAIPPRLHGIEIKPTAKSNGFKIRY
jgi:hypothetical protein